MPPELIGRQDVINDFTTGLRNGAGAPERLMLVTGQRGYGKTVMLTELEETARSFGWETYRETASADMTARLIEKLGTKRFKTGKASISPAVSIPGIASLELGSVEMSMADRTVAMRDLINARLKKLPEGAGIMFAIDEAQAASKDDLIALATTVQHVIHDEDMTGLDDGKQHGIALVFAALPNLIDDLINDKVLTFLRRAIREEMGPIPIPDIRNAFVKTATASGKTISTKDAEAAANETGGNPFLVQLIGYYMWESADTRASKEIRQPDVDQGVKDAFMRYKDAVCAPTFASMSSAQQEFLAAMANTYPEPASLADIADYTGKSASWVDKYRISLIRAHAIAKAGPGKVKYAIPHFGEWMTENCR